MFILRLAVKTFNLAKAELSNDLSGKEDNEPSNYLPYPPSPPPYSVDPIIFQFGRKRKDVSIDASDGHRQLFCPKRLRLDPSSEVISILHSAFPSCEESQNKAKRHDSANQLKNSLLISKRRPPLNVLYHNRNQGAPSHLSTLVEQWLVTTFRDQLLAIQSSWTPPKEEPLDLSFKQPNLKLTSDNVFGSILKLVELQPDSEVRGHNTFPLSRPLEATHIHPHNIEMLMSSVLLFNNLKSNLLDGVNRTNFIGKEPDSLQPVQRRLKFSGRM
ncbi:hypothetical protein Aperf_G00000041973 [Anoplocephala perfoliata]